MINNTDDLLSYMVKINKICPASLRDKKDNSDILEFAAACLSILEESFEKEKTQKNNEYSPIIACRFMEFLNTVYKIGVLDGQSTQMMSSEN